MRTLITIVLLVGAALASLASSDDPAPSPGPMCRVGCPCGRACIDCNDTCHMEDQGGAETEDAGP